MKISDYKDNDAIELWADIIEPLSTIMTDDEIKKMWKNKDGNLFNLAGKILKLHPKEAKEIMLRVDKKPINGVNMLPRVISIMSELIQGEQSGFFNSAEQVNEEKGSSGSATENTRDGEA